MLVYLKPFSLFPNLHSDTIFGALIYSINILYPDKTDSIIEEFNSEEPPFIISSTFPFAYDGDKKIKFYPKIIMDEKNSNNEKVNMSDMKEFKKINFLQDEIFFKLLKGEIKYSDIIENFNQYYRVKDLLLIKKSDFKFNYNNTVIPNNFINRLNNQSEEIFYNEGKEFNNLGLFFLIEFNNKEYEPIIRSSLKFLKDRGFGKDISSGKGQFDYEIIDYSINDEELKSGDYFVTLSRFIPTNTDLSHINEYSNYELSSKRGRSSNGEIRKQVSFFKEGSIFPDYQKFYGQIIDSGEKNPSLEYGLAFPIPLNKGGGY